MIAVTYYPRFPRFSGESLAIACSNWKLPGDKKVAASVQLGYNETALFLKFDVAEPLTNACFLTCNSPVYTESCVELFISFDEATYTNLEFNAIGTVLGQRGTSRSNRIFLSPELLETIEVFPSLGRAPVSTHAISWQLAVNIPAAVFGYAAFTEKILYHVTGNIYTCGDALPQKRYLSLFPIATAKPDFHTPQFFGKITFLPQLQQH